MSLLRDTAWRLKYTPDDGDLVRLFYVPALRSAVRYDRLTGYFSARALALAARGVEGLIVNNGRMRLIVGCTLDEAEVTAIEKGESIRNAVERQVQRMAALTADPRAIDSLELLAWMVGQGILDVKLAVPCDTERRPVRDESIFHEKAGIIEDKTGDRLAFNGSINETEFGWTRNWESFNAFTSWSDGPRVDQEEASFAKLWADKARRAITIDVPTALRDQLLTFLPDPGQLPKRLRERGEGDAPQQAGKPPASPPSRPPVLPEAGHEEERKLLWERIAKAPLQPVGGDRVGEATSAVVPWPHQVRAFHRLYDHWPPKLLIADEVGLGKTIQAGLLLRQAWLAGRAKRILVLAPKGVCRQWQIELREKFNLNWPIYDGQKLNWYRSPAREDNFEKLVTRDSWHQESFVIMSSHLARRQDRQREILEGAEPWDLVVLDEAHHARTKGAGTAQARGRTDFSSSCALCGGAPMGSSCSPRHPCRFIRPNSGTCLTSLGSQQPGARTSSCGFSQRYPRPPSRMTVWSGCPGSFASTRFISGRSAGRRQRRFRGSAASRPSVSFRPCEIRHRFRGGSCLRTSGEPQSRSSSAAHGQRPYIAAYSRLAAPLFPGGKALDPDCDAPG